tara:strand:- start:1114 stop:2946 length:1833 start_codon:yes stop_codon:yes gene_type:complete
MKNNKNFLFLLFFYTIANAQQLIVYTDIPGRAQSDHYQCRVREVGTSDWQSAFVLQTNNKPETYDNGYKDDLYGWTASWINFEFENTSVEVEISKVDGTPITSAKVRPTSKASAAEIINGKAYVIFDNPANINVDINGQLEDQYTGMGYDGDPVHTISIFANPVIDKPDINDPNVYALEPGEAIPDASQWSTLYFKPGIHSIAVPYILQSNKNFYIPGDAIVHGTIHTIDEWGATQNISVYGYGALSGENIYKTKQYSTKPISRHASNARFEGIVIVDPAYHAITFDNTSDNIEEKNIFKNIKILGWRTNGDGIHAFRNSEISDCFIRTQDDSFYYSNSVHIRNCVVWNDYNGAVIRVIKGDETSGTSSFQNIDVIYHRAGWHYWNGGRIISFRHAGPNRIIKNVFIKNINVEDPFPAFPPFYFTMGQDEDPPPDNGSNTQIMENILIENVVQLSEGVSSELDQNYGKPQNTILGFDSSNQFSNIKFKNSCYNGIALHSLSDGEFLTNEFINNITFEVSDSSWACNFLNKNDISNNSISFFPNPFKDILSVDSVDYITSAALYSLNGKKIKYFDIGSKTFNLDLSDLPTDAFLLRFKINDFYKTSIILKK